MNKLTNKQLSWILAGTVVTLFIVLALGFQQRSLRQGQVIRAALDKLTITESLHAKADFTMHLPKRLRNIQRPFREVHVTIEGDVKKDETNFPQITGKLNGDLTGPGNTFFFNGDVRIFNDAVAFHLVDFPALLNPRGTLSNRWTYVPTSLLSTKNGSDVTRELKDLASNLKYKGTKKISGISAYHYTGSFSAEQEQTLSTILGRAISGNLALDVIARLLAANNVKSFDLYVNTKTNEITRLAINFVRPLTNGSEVSVVDLNLSFTDYGKKVSIDRPEEQAKARPEIFAKLFGTSNVGSVTVEAN